MTTKDYVIAFLENVINDWAPARGLLQLIQEGNVDQPTLDKLSSLLQTSVLTQDSKQQLNKLYDTTPFTRSPDRWTDQKG